MKQQRSLRASSRNSIVRRGDPFLRRVGTPAALAAILASTLVGCGDELPEIEESSAPLTGVCDRQVWGAANDIMGALPGVGTATKLFVGLSKLGQRYGCASSNEAILQIADVRNIAASQIQGDNTKKLEKAIENISKNLVLETSYTKSGLLYLLGEIEDAETEAATFSWGSLHLMANLASMKYGVTVAMVDKEVEPRLRQAAIQRVRQELKQSIDELDKVEKAYVAHLRWGPKTDHRDNGGNCGGRGRLFTGFAKLDGIEVDGSSMTCNNLVCACKNTENLVRRSAEQRFDEVRRLHRQRTLTPEYLALRAKLNAAYANFAYERATDECRIRELSTGRYLTHVHYTSPTGTLISRAPSVGSVASNDSSRADFYQTNFRLIDVKIAAAPRSIMLGSTISPDSVVKNEGTGAVGWGIKDHAKSMLRWTLRRSPLSSTEVAYYILSDGESSRALTLNNQGQLVVAPWGLLSSQWVFEGNCARIQNDKDLHVEGTKLRELANATPVTGTKFVSRVWNKGRPNLKLVILNPASGPELSLRDLSEKPGESIFRFVGDTARATHDSLDIRFVSNAAAISNQNLHPPGVSTGKYALRRIRGNVFSIQQGSSGRYLRAGSSGLELSSTFDDQAQWTLADVDAGFGEHAIEIAPTGKCMDISGGITANGTQIQQWKCLRNGSRMATHPNMTFELLKQGDDGYQVVHSASRKCVDVAAGGTSNGTKIQLWGCGGAAHANQIFRIEYVSSPFGKPTFKIINKRNGKCLALSGGSHADGEHIQLYDCINNDANQMFSLRFLADDFCHQFDGQTVALKTAHNRYVRAGDSGEGFIVNQATAIGAYERLNVSCDGGKVALGTTHGRYIQPQASNNYDVRQQTFVGDYEKLHPVKAAGGVWGFKTFHARFLRAGGSATGYRLGQGPALSSFEEFDVQKQN